MIATAKLIKAFEKFNADVESFREMTGDEYATLYEDALTTREVKDFKLYKNGKLVWKEDGVTEVYEHYDEDDVRDSLSFWRSCLRRAKKYWSMSSEDLDAIQDGDKDDID